ncbi:hypothetical protein CEXT_85641 [Caerostris extrusa]|uniref:Uncharacterized protein n=1 Tax=Caerostris extrusa TaxID=172846 RepID=A0AAV4SFX4_CAEEX|nr:hypothetical protein CEXT_85641 [Caerostris extrusa]
MNPPPASSVANKVTWPQGDTVPRLPRLHASLPLKFKAPKGSLRQETFKLISQSPRQSADSTPPICYSIAHHGASTLGTLHHGAGCAYD